MKRTICIGALALSACLPKSDANVDASLSGDGATVATGDGGDTGSDAASSGSADLAPSACPATGAFDADAPQYAACTKVVFAVGGRGGRRTVVDEAGAVLLDYTDPRFAMSDASTADHKKTWSVAIGRGAIVFIGNLGTFVSTDGVTHTRLTQGADPGTDLAVAPDDMHVANIRCVAGRFVAVSGSRAWYSDDAMTWTRTYETSWSGHTTGLAGDGTRWVAVNGNAKLVSADNGLTWTPGTLPGGFDARTIAYGNGKFVAKSGDDPAAMNVSTSTDGVTWTTPASSTNGFRGHLLFADGKFLGAGSIYSLQGASSTDGATFSRVNFSHRMGGIAYHGGGYAGFYQAGTPSMYHVAKSTDGVTFTSVWSTPSSETSSLSQIAAGRIRK